MERLILNFHGIGEPPYAVPDDERPYWCPRSEWPPLADAIAEVAAQRKVQVEITFDDGNLSDVEEGLPILVERELTATFHVCAGRIDRPHFLTSDHLRTLTEAGMEIGSHGWSHIDLRRAPSSELSREAEESRVRIAEVSRTEITKFAIPFGSYDRRVLRALRGYPTVFTSDRVRAPMTGWLIPRHSYEKGWRPADIERFALERPSIAGRARRRAVAAYKRWR